MDPASTPPECPNGAVATKRTPDGRRRRVLIRAFLAGIAISIGGCVYLACDVKWVGAVLFSVGLLTVVAFRLDLYTGKVGYAVENPPSYWKDILVIIVGNFLGCLLVGLMMPYDAAVDAVDAKLRTEWYSVVFKGVMCGVLMFIAVDFHRQRGSFLAIFLCVPAFILAGFEHSIADMFYVCSAGAFSLGSLAFILLVLLGNAIGCMIVPFCRKYMYDPPTDDDANRMRRVPLPIKK